MVVLNLSLAVGIIVVTIVRVKVEAIAAPEGEDWMIITVIVKFF
ncbi:MULTISPECIES: hypothetical protein [unclassified Microcoleus]